MQQTQPCQAVIERIVERAPDTRSLFLQLPVSEKTLTRAYTIASSPEEAGPLEICFNLVPNGPGSHCLFTRTVGDILTFTGPWGHFVLDQPPQAPCVFIAGGMGIAAIRPMLRRALSARVGFPIHLIYGAQTEGGFLYHEQLAAWASSHADLSLSFVLNAGHGLQGDVCERVTARYVHNDTDRARHFYICGIGQRVIQLRDVLRKAGYERRAVQYEKW